MSWVSLIRGGLLSVGLLLGGFASAAPWAVESPSVASLTEAEGIQRKLPALPDGASARVVRRYERGAGWRYLVHVEPLDQHQVARTIAAHLDAGGKVIDLANGEVEEIAHLSTGKAAPTHGTTAAPPQRPTLDRAQRRDLDTFLRAVIKAHGGVEGGVAIMATASSLEFEFQREVIKPEVALVARHRWLAMGTARRLEIDVRSGNGLDSVSVITPGGQAFVEAQGNWVERDIERTRSVIERFGPNELLAIPLGLAADVDTASIWRGVTLEAANGGTRSVVPLVAGSELVRATFSSNNHLLERIEVDGGDGPVSYVFSRYRTVQVGLILPMEVELYKGGTLVERVKVETIRINGSLAGELFRPDRAVP